MKGEKALLNNPHTIVSFRWIGNIFLLLLLAEVVYGAVYSYNCIDGCGPYHNTTSVADLDGDGDLDVLLSGLRHENETVFWAGSLLWINQGGRNFTLQRPDLGGSFGAVGDIDGDGDADSVQMAWWAKIYFNQGGEQGGTPGDFKEGYSIYPPQDLHKWSTPGTVVLGDLNGDSRLDALISYCCSMLIDDKAGDDDFYHFLPYAWINLQDENGYPIRVGFNLTSLGDLPMRPTLGDLDGDGDLDVYAASLPPKKGNYDPADRILLNDGSGVFTDSGQRLENRRKTGASGSGAVALGDLNGDGDLDALVATASGASLWINQGGAQGGQAGVFARSEQRLGRGHIEAVFLSDLDADGSLDALVAGKSSASIWWNDGRGIFRDSGQRLRFTQRHGLAVADFNTDGYADVFSAANDEFHLWLNQGDGTLREIP